ncbi:hypothetical protein J4G63_02750 [Aeromonas sobria]|jgi:hypothetical protein|uniref:Uncharacterized protein n=1 Tax=Aeromonas sobria TaxID=646 RepID=A0A1S2CW81_AERSO|nr:MULTISPECIES: hypothetical protein [Aeromonas]EKP0258873.1 hypothetical protein [Aeromonas sobria]MBS4686179.1 hypothetical protein [Aeromonas sobria]MCX7128419.1 hypothetical protein [Aeromonas sp.]OHY91921.1 hypothetical protein BJD16_15050 [Aeromonas sobria]TNI84147.1 hypothetical protein CF119_14180 [Aeromonas sobria]
MVKITLVSLLHSLCPRFPVYPTSLLTSLLDAHQGEVWLPARKGADIAVLRKHVKGAVAHELASLNSGWCDFAASDSGDTPELDALANYDTEMMDNLLMYWHSAVKINSPITDNLFELRREVVDEAHGAKLAAAWEQQQQLRFEQLMAMAANGGDLLCFVEVESAYWLRQKLSEQTDITLCSPSIA